MRQQEPRELGESSRSVAELEASIVPPPELEEIVVARLRDERLLERSETPRWGWLVAAGVLAFAAGMLFATWGGRHGRATPSAADDRPVYALLLYQGADFTDATGEHAPERVDEYRRWVGSLREGGRFADGERLASEGMVLGGHAPASYGGVVEGPEGRLSGFFLIEAADDREARSIAEGCPHLDHGGTVEVRRVERGG